MTPLSDDEKKTVVDRFTKLALAIDTDGDVEGSFAAFQSAYRGNSRAYVDAFHNAADRKEWIGQLALYLKDEIEPSFWSVRENGEERCPECGTMGVGSPMQSTFQGAKWTARIFTCPNPACGHSWAEGEGLPPGSSN